MVYAVGDIEKKFLRGRPAGTLRRRLQRTVAIHIDFAIHALLLTWHRIVSLRDCVRRPFSAIDGEMHFGGRRIVLKDYRDGAKRNADTSGRLRRKKFRSTLDLRLRESYRLWEPSVNRNFCALRLALARHSAEGKYWAAVALRTHRRATRLAERNEMAVPCLPILYWKDFPESHFRIERRLRLDKPKPVADAVNMHVDANRRKVKANGDGEVRSLPPDARKFAQFLDSVGQDAAEFLLENFRERLQVPCLVVIEADGEDQFFDFLRSQSLKVFWCKARALRLCEEPSHRACSAGVLRASREDCSDEDTERIVRLRLDQLDDRRRMRLEFLLQRTVDFRYVANFHTNP